MRKPALIEFKLSIMPPIEGELTNELMDRALASAQLWYNSEELQRSIEADLRSFPALKGFQVKIVEVE